MQPRLSLLQSLRTQFRSVGNRMLRFWAVVILVAASVITPYWVWSAPSPQALIEQARSQYQAANYEASAETWQEIAVLFEAQNDPLNQAMALGNLVLSEQALGQREFVSNNLMAGLRLVDSQPTSPEQSRIRAALLDIQGQEQLIVGQPNEALSTWRTALSIHEEQENSFAIAQSQINQAQALQRLGLYPRACSLLLQSLDRERLDCRISESDLETLEQPSSVSQQILALRSLGNVLRVMNDPVGAQLALNKSLQLSQASGNDASLGEIYLSLGNTAQALSDRKLENGTKKPVSTTSTRQTCAGTVDSPSSQQAADCYRLAAQSPNPKTQTQAQLNLLDLSFEQQDWPTVSELISQIPANLSELPDSQTSVDAHLKFLRTLTCLKATLQPDQTDLRSPIVQQCVKPDPLVAATPQVLAALPSWLEMTGLAMRAYEQADMIGSLPAQANALGYLASVYQQQGDLSQAQALTEQALQLLIGVSRPDVRYLWQWQLGQLQLQQGNLDSAIAAYTLAFNDLQTLRQDLVSNNRDLQFTFRDRVEPVYRDLVDLLLQGDQPSQDNLLQARQVIESLQIAELNNFFQEACLEARARNIDDIDPQGALFYSIVLPERLAVIVSIPGQPLSYFATPVTAETVEETFGDLQERLNPLISTPDPLRPHQQFYDWLIRPAIAKLEASQIETLVFVPDGVLINLPLAALHDGQQFLVEQYGVAMTPSLELLSQNEADFRRKKTLAAGLVEAREGFPPLPEVTQELKAVSKIVPAQVLLDDAFTRDRLEQSLQSNPEILHLATHGQFSSQAAQTFLLTWEGRINVKDFDRLLPNTAPIELLILSACQTATGDQRATLGLAGFAVRTKARSTLATLWSVQDKSTALLVPEFYRGLNDANVGKAEALRRAQLSLLQDPSYQHPFYWAGMVLVGNWQ